MEVVHLSAAVFEGVGRGGILEGGLAGEHAQVENLVGGAEQRAGFERLNRRGYRFETTRFRGAIEDMNILPG
jgi:hypothetical protein